MPQVSPAQLVYVLMMQAVNDLPAVYRDRLDNVEFRVMRTLSPRDRRRLGVRGTLYGLYEGISLPRRAAGYDQVTPDRVTLFWGPLMRDFDGRDLEEEVRKTVLHEIGHYFGLEESDLHSTRVE